MNDRNTRRRRIRAEAPLWQQASEGIGLVLMYAGVVVAVGAALSVVVSLFFS